MVLFGWSPRRVGVLCSHFYSHELRKAVPVAWRSRKVTLAELSHFAKINRVERVMPPYLEAMTQ